MCILYLWHITCVCAYLKLYYVSVRSPCNGILWYLVALGGGGGVASYLLYSFGVNYEN